MNPQEDGETGMAQMIRWPSAHLFGPEEREQLLESSDAAVMQRSRSKMLDAVQDMTAKLGGDLVAAAQSFQKYGLQRKKVQNDGYGAEKDQSDVWTFREWIPNASAAYLVGDFNGWDNKATPLTQEEGTELWSCEVPSCQAKNLQQGQKYKVYVEWPNSSPSWLIPAQATRMTFTSDLNMFDAIIHPVESQSFSPAPAASGSERIYECHLGLAHAEGSAKSFREAERMIIPRAVRDGYTALLVIGVQEGKSYADMGSLPCAYFAPTSALGTPEELQSFVQKAHEAGLRVYMSPAHEGAAWCPDGLPDFYFRSGGCSTDPITGARLFDYDKPEVVRYLLANLAYWMKDYGFDGFRFDSVASIVYAQHGRWLPKDVQEIDEYVQKPGMVNSSAIQYLMLANTMVHEMGKNAVTIADEPSLFPGVCVPVQEGGLGFDVRQTSASGLFHRLMQKSDEEWTIEELVQGLTRSRTGRPGEKVLASVQSARDSVVSKKPLKIAMLAWETLHTIAVGGVAPHVTELAGALHGAGHEVHIFTRAQGMMHDHEILGVHYHEVTYNTAGCIVQDTRNMCSAFVWALNGHESVWGAFDIIHGHDWLAGPGVMELKGQGKKTVFTMHSTEGGRNGDMGKGHPGVKDIERSGCAYSDMLIAVSGVLKDEVCWACGADDRKMSVIYNGIHAAPIVNMPWEDEWSGNAKEDKGFGRMDPMFLFVGRHTAQKGCDLLIEAIPHILNCRGDAKFVIVGDGHLFAHNTGRVNALGVGHAVHFTGSLKSGSAHLKALFKACDAVVVPSRNEPFGIVVLEAWASGKPVVATTSGGPRDFVKPGEDGYLVDPEPGSIAWGCCKILENFEHSKWMGKNAQAKALREFSWEHIAKETERVYYDLLNLQSAPRTSDKTAGCPLAHALLAEKCFDMKVSDSDPIVSRGLSLLKMTKLLVASLSGDSMLTWMGSEFGQIDPVDMPRLANGFSDEFSRIKYELADNKELKFSQLEAFEAALNSTAQEQRWLLDKEHSILVQSEEDKVLAFARGGAVFVFNLHPTEKYSDYKIEVPAGLGKNLQTLPVLTTEDSRFGGSAAAAAEASAAVAEAKGGMVMTVKSLTPRTGLVFSSQARKGAAAASTLPGA
eukprot:TRINITY_DN61354_c0_g1_i1.p1 TRINITY_DN61354_c0_g1~~TRINITY_DN61354_c0_g1_i1.p1  ORF type:complete len:1120 (+),score=261.27 TRINITY_DN61354_c0_g1_i1:54-3413(+)